MNKGDFTMASLKLNHIYKIYSGNVTAVSDFCLDIEDKEFIVLVGPSGCGKSTTLRMVAALPGCKICDLLSPGRHLCRISVVPQDNPIELKVIERTVIELITADEECV